MADIEARVPAEERATTVPESEQDTQQSNEERAASDCEDEIVSQNEKYLYGIWGFLFGLVLGVVLGSIPMCCCIKHKKRKKFYMIGWAIGAIISIGAYVIVAVLTRGQT